MVFYFKIFIYFSITIFFSIVGNISLVVPNKMFRKNFISLLGKMWVKSIFFITNIKINVITKKPIDFTKANLIISNHSSALDIPIIMYLCSGRVNFMAKKELFKIPLWGWLLKYVDNIPIDRGNAMGARKAIVSVIDRLNNNGTVLIFPEGTRSKTGKIQPFKKGSFIIARNSTNTVNIVPVTIVGASRLMPKGSLKCSSGTITVVVNEGKTNKEITDINDMNDFTYNTIRGDLEYYEKI